MCFRKSESNLYLGPAEPQKANSYRYQFTYTLRKGIELTPARADGTARAAEWESRSLPGFFYPFGVTEISETRATSRGPGRFSARPTKGSLLKRGQGSNKGKGHGPRRSVGHTPLLYFGGRPRAQRAQDQGKGISF